MTSSAHKKQATQFIAIMERAGAHVDYSIAGTGTVYVTVCQSYKVRFADHGECYCREDISVDPDGCTLEQAVRAAARECDLDVTRSLAAFKAAATRKAKAAAEYAAAHADEYAQIAVREDARIEFQAAFIAAHFPDYAQRPSKARARCRAAANKAFEASYA